MNTKIKISSRSCFFFFCFFTILTGTYGAAPVNIALDQTPPPAAVLPAAAVPLPPIRLNMFYAGVPQETYRLEVDNGAPGPANWQPITQTQFFNILNSLNNSQEVFRTIFAACYLTNQQIEPPALVGAVGNIHNMQADNTIPAANTRLCD